MKTGKFSARLCLLVLLLASCQGHGEQNKSENKEDKKVVIDNGTKSPEPDNSIVKEVLKSQLIDGKEIGGDEYESHHYTENDLQATVLLARELLTENGYKFPDQENFDTKIKSFFDRTVDASSAKKQLYINFNDPCNKEQIYSRVVVIANGVHVIKGDRFITDLYAVPELIDYQAKFPELSAVEDAKITKTSPDLGNSIEIPHWKDVEDLKGQRKKNVQTLVARNMYLFNGSKEHGQWLRLNDARFLKSLVTVFGYTEDQDLLKWVIENNPYDKEHPYEFSKLLWHKTCDGKLIFYKKTLEIIAENKEQAKDVFSFLNNDYINYILNSKDSAVDLTREQKEEIIAGIHSFIL